MKRGNDSGSWARRLSSTFFANHHAAALELGDLLGLQLVEVGGLAHELGLDELRDQLVAPLERTDRTDPVLDPALDERAALALRQPGTRRSSRAGALQVAHFVGGLCGLPRWTTTSSTYRITSLRRDTSTSSPIPIPSAAMFPALCSDARRTTAPASSTGSTTATGETRPDEPVSHTMSTSFVTWPAMRT